MGAAAEIALCPVEPSLPARALLVFILLMRDVERRDPSRTSIRRVVWKTEHPCHPLLACYPSRRERLRYWRPQLSDPEAGGAEGQGSPRQRSGE